MWDGASNLFLFHAYLVLQYIGLSLFYAEVFKSRFIHVILGVGLGIIVGQYYFIDDLRSYFNMYGIAGTQLVLILYAIYYFFHFLGKKSEYLLINIGILMYLLCSTLIFSSGSFLKSENEIFLQKYRYLWDLNIILYFLFQVLLGVNWRMRYYKTKAKLHEHIEWMAGAYFGIYSLDIACFLFKGVP